MTTGTMSALEGSSSSLGGIVQANWYYFFYQQQQGADVFNSPIYFPLASTGLLSAFEAEDIFSASGGVLIDGYLQSSEVGSDEFSAEGIVITDGVMYVVESGADSMEASGNVLVYGSFDASESGKDTFYASGKAPVQQVLTGGRRNENLVWGEWPVLDDEEVRKIKRKRNELLLLLH
jgi:hypothetical protein